MGFARTCALKKNCGADPIARLFVACTRAALISEFNPPNRMTEKVVHEGEDVFSDSVPYVLLLEYSNKPSESDEERPRMCGEYVTPQEITTLVKGSPQRVRGIQNQTLHSLDQCFC